MATDVRGADTTADLGGALRTELREILTETFRETKGIYLDRATSIFDTLAGISAEQASRPVSSACATIAAQTEHVRFYLDVLEQHLLGQPVDANWGEIWGTVTAVTAEEWNASRDRLREAYERVDRLINELDVQGENYISGSLAVIVHSAYHLGEIRQALCVVQPPPARALG